MVINEKELLTLKLIFRKFQELKSLTKLETYLMNNNIKTRKGTYYSLFALRWILTNPVYVQNDEKALEYFKEKKIHVYAEEDNRNKFDGSYGFLTYHKTSGNKNLPKEEWILAVGLHPGIIPSTEWIAVQMLLEKNADKRYRAAGYTQKQTIVSGLIRCKHCGSLMRPRNMGTRKSDNSVNYRYYCVLKEKSRCQKCNAKNVSGEELDKKIVDIIKSTFVPNSAIYEELKNMTFSKKGDTYNDELEILEKQYNQKQDEINKIVEKLTYIDIDLMDMINTNLKKLKQEKEDLEKKIQNIKSGSISNTTNNNNEVKTAKNILKILDNSFKTFDMYDLKTKRDLVKIFIESIYGEGDDVEINFLNTKLDETTKTLFVPSITKVNDFFLDTNLPPDKVGKITFKK